MIAPTIMELPEREMRFISLLANTAGSALENAKLYEQSKRLIADLQLINETIHHLNTNLRFQDALQFMIEKLKRHLMRKKSVLLFCKKKSVKYFLEVRHFPITRSKGICRFRFPPHSTSAG